MGSRLTTSDAPVYLGEDGARVLAPCEPVRRGGQTWYLGTGVSPQEHPLARSIAFEPCGRCGARDVRVVAAQFAVHLMTGDRYHDYEIACRACGAFTQRSFAEND